MTSRDQILKSVRATILPPQELPSLTGPWIAYDDLVAQFETALQGVGGRPERIACYEDIAAVLTNDPNFTKARKIVSLVPQGAVGNVKQDEIDDPHRLEDVDFAIMPGQFGVAENAAIWVTHHDVKHRALWFIAQHLVLVISTDEIVPNMHTAYDRIRNIDSGFGAFISGPSKTADIEQSLVMGAHGPRTLTVCLVNHAP